MKLFLKFLCTMLCVGVISSCSKGSTPGGLPAACASSSSPYLEYSAYKIRQATAYANGYDSYIGADGENALSNDVIAPNIRYAHISLDIWLKAHPECRTGAVAKLASALTEVDDAPIRSKDIPAVKELSFIGAGASDSLGLSIGFTPVPGPDSNNQDVLVPRPLDVVGVPKSYDDSGMIAWIDLYNSGVN